MGVPVYKRTESPLQVLDMARTLRCDISKVLLKRLFNNNLYKENLVTENNTQLETQETYPQFLVDFIRKTLLELLQKLVQSIIMANAIYPTTRAELDKRIALQNEAIGFAEALQGEFLYCADVFPTQLRCLLSYADQVDHMIKVARRWKKANNKILQRVQNEEKKRPSPTTSNFCNCSNNGNANYNDATNVNGVAPDFIAQQAGRMSVSATMKGGHRTY